MGSLRGLALDEETGRLYLADNQNNRIDVFTEGGSFLFAFGWGVIPGGGTGLEKCTLATTCKAGSPGSGAGQLEKPTKVAVDNGPGSSSTHAIYVVDANFRVQKFDPEGEFVWMIGEGVDQTDNGDLCTKAEGHTCGAGTASEGPGGFKSRLSIDVGPGGVLHVLDNLLISGVEFKHRLQRFRETGEPIVPPPPAECILFEGGRANDIAVDGSGNLWVANEQAGKGIRKYDPSCAKVVGPIDESGVSTIELALDESDDLFASQLEARDKAVGALRVITAHDTAGAITRRFAYGRIPDASVPQGLAVRNNGEGGIFIAPSRFDLLGIEGIKRLDFPPPPPTLPTPGPIPAPPSLEVSGIGSTKATLSGEVNPEGKASEAHFEYLTQEEYEGQGGFEGEATKKTPSVPLGATGFRLKYTEAAIGCPDPANEAGQPGNDCLLPETTYRWQVVATNADNPSGAGESTAEGQPFKTKSLEIGEIWATRVGTDTARLNGEVNPNSIPATGYFEYVDDARFQASGFTEAIKAPNVDEGAAPLGFGAGEAFATRGISIAPLAPGTIYHYRLIAENPLVEPKVSEPDILETFEPPEVDHCPNDASRIGAGAYLPDCRAYEMVSPVDKEGGDIQVGTTDRAEPAVLEQSSLSGDKLAYGSFRSFGDALSAPFTSQYIARRVEGKGWETHSINPPRGKPISDGGLGKIEFKAFSDDLCEAWQTTFAEPPLASGAPEDISNLYRRTDPLCSEEGKTHHEWLASDAEELLGLSQGGEHAIFVSDLKQADGGIEGTRQLYEYARGAEPPLALVCFLPGGEPVSGACAAGSTTLAGDPGAGARAISSDGRRIFWSPGSGGGSGIYARIESSQTIPISEAAEEAEGTEGSWFWGAADDGGKAIFSTGDLSLGKATLYEFDVDVAIGTPTVGTPIAEGVLGVTGISGDAARVYFASEEAIAGSGQNSEGEEAEAGQANLYLYEAGGGTKFIATLAAGDLTAAVSNARFGLHNARVSPDGAHAAFVSLASLTGYDNRRASDGTPTQEVYRYDADDEDLLCVSCNPSRARPAGHSTIPFFETSIHAARVLVDDGSRVFFQSADALAARDTNGKVDVYQWEELGAGSCDEDDAGFSADAQGCIELISSGQSPNDSRFVEATPTAEDVFFATGASLLPQDAGVFDIYNARVNGGLPVPQGPPPGCEGEACQSPPAPPNDPTPASSTYQGAGNVEESAKKKACRKGRVRRKGKCVRKHRRHRRANDNRRAAR